MIPHDFGFPLQEEKIQKKEITILRASKARTYLYIQPPICQVTGILGEGSSQQGGNNPIRYFSGDPMKNSRQSQSCFGAAARMCLLALPRTRTHL